MNRDLPEKLLDISRKMAENRILNPLLEYAMTVALDLFDAEYGYLVLLQEILLIKTDQALYAAKEAGRNRISVFDVKHHKLKIIENQ